MDKRARSETGLEDESRTAHKLMIDLEADALLLITLRVSEPIMRVNTVVGTILAESREIVRRTALRQLAGALREAADRVEQMQFEDEVTH